MTKMIFPHSWFNSRSSIAPVLLLLLMASPTLGEPQWTRQKSGVSARLRGVSVVNDRVVWVSGAESTVLRTSDGGESWLKLKVTDEQLDFRDVDAVDESTAYVLSIGNGPASRIYKTSDAGRTWILQYRNIEPKVFLDAMTFWDKNRGIVFGDSIDRQFFILTTTDGGKTWTRVAPSLLPRALENEGAFAASGTNIALYGETHVWIATGAGARARVLRSTDRGRSWKVVDTPMASGPSAGIFSIAFRDTEYGVVVGGDYRKEREAVNNLAVTTDGGRRWKLVEGLSGYRSVVAYVPGVKSSTLIAVGPSGADYSLDDGMTWRILEGPGFDTLGIAHGKQVGWAAGAEGAIARISF
jgi:photosystem II stability/assembly factor-like uncharacterized protein